MFGQQCARANKAEATAVPKKKRERIQQQLKPFSSKQTAAAAAVATFLDILHDVLVLHCPVHSVSSSSSALCAYLLASCTLFGLPKKKKRKERVREGK